jgi:hypothetical protein
MALLPNQGTQSYSRSSQAEILQITEPISRIPYECLGLPGIRGAEHGDTGGFRLSAGRWT